MTRLAIKAVCFGAGIALALGAQAHDMTIEILGGTDTNPNKLQSTLDLDTGNYMSARVEFQHTVARTGVYYELEGVTDFYETDESFSNETNSERLNGKAVLGFKWRPKVKYQRARFIWEVDYHLKDSVYIDRETGDVKRFWVNNEVIGERFDATWYGFRTSADIPLSQDAEMKLYARWFTKEYQSYPGLELLGLDNLNYEQAEFEIGFEKEIWPHTKLETTIGVKVRDYVDRRAKAYGQALLEDGTDIADSNESFRYFEAKNGLEVSLGKRWDWNLGLNVEQRQDDYDGYRNSLIGKFYTSLDYRNKKYTRFKIKAAYVFRRMDNLEYDTDPTNDPDIEDGEQRHRKGIRASAEFTKAITNFTWSNLDLIIGASYDSFENTQAIFTYERVVLYSGIRWRPY